MAFRIETAARGKFTVFVLSGRIEKEAIAELKRLFECQTDYRDIENCTPYIREWMEREKD
jgi:hypothetical protein